MISSAIPQLSSARPEKARLEALKDALPNAGRDHDIRQLHKHLGLSQSDRQKLKERGLTDEQIETGLFFSVRDYGIIPDWINSRLPGVIVRRDGRKYLKGDQNSSIACVAFEDGKAIGWQYRHPREENKYTWAKGIKSSHLDNGELPITHLISNQDDKTLWITEGILKPYITHSKFNLNVAGASGFNFSFNHQQVSKIIKTYDYKKIIIALDAGAIVNPHVMEQFERNVKLFKSFGCEIEIAWWGQISKENKD